MKILVVTHYFPPEIGAPQARLGDLTRMWAEAGEDVTVLTCMPNHPTGIVPPEYRGRWRLRERVNGADVVRTWVYATPNEGVFKKTLGHLSFMLSSVLLGWRAVGCQDVVVVSSPTFFSIFSAWLLARVKRAPLVVEVRDLWPAIFVELGVLKNRRLIAVLERLEMAAYRAAASVVVVSDGFREDLLGRGVAPEKVVTIPNGVDLERFPSEVVDRSEWRDRLGAADGDTLALYIGAHGISHGLDVIIEAAAHTDVRIAFVGEGARKGALLEQAREAALQNVVFHPGVPSSVVPEVLAAADMCLVPLRGDVPLFSTFIPSKMFEFFAAEKAVVAAVRGEPAAILERAGALVIEPGDPRALAEAIDDLSADPGRRREMGVKARAYVASAYDRRVLAARYRQLLSGIVR